MDRLYEGARQLSLRHISIRIPWNDSGWSGVVCQRPEDNIACLIPPRSNRKKQYHYDRHLYEESHLVECLINKIKHYRRIFSRFDKLARRYLGSLSLVGALIWLR